LPAECSCFGYSCVSLASNAHNVHKKTLCRLMNDRFYSTGFRPKFNHFRPCRPETATQRHYTASCTLSAPSCVVAMLGSTCMREVSIELLNSIFRHSRMPSTPLCKQPPKKSAPGRLWPKPVWPLCEASPRPFDRCDVVPNRRGPTAPSQSMNAMDCVILLGPGSRA
jgi:hypothetical protein